MWTKRNDHTARSGCADFFNISPKRAVLGKMKFDHFVDFNLPSLAYTCLHLSCHSSFSSLCLKIQQVWSKWRRGGGS